MYYSLPSFILGFHGCDKKLKDEVLSGKKQLKISKNSYDWLGNGIYFWENNPERALEYAKEIKKYPERYNTSIKNPAVLGAAIDLGKCINFLDSKFIKLLKVAHKTIEDACKKDKMKFMLENTVLHYNIYLKRDLDCIVVETVNSLLLRDNPKGFDSVRAAYFEGNPVYPTAGFMEKSHIQVCIRNPNCIKGYFSPLKEDPKFTMP